MGHSTETHCVPGESTRSGRPLRCPYPFGAPPLIQARFASREPRRHPISEQHHHGLSRLLASAELARVLQSREQTAPAASSRQGGEYPVPLHILPEDPPRPKGA